MDLLVRLRWGIVLVLGLALMYRFTDAVWGSLAYAFYLGENYGALGHSLDDVAIASKFSGVIATIFGAFLGAALITLLGRLPILFIGAIVAAVTNLHLDVPVHNVTADQSQRARLEETAGKHQAPCLMMDGQPQFEAADILKSLADRIAPLP